MPNSGLDCSASPPSPMSELAAGITPSSRMVRSASRPVIADSPSSMGT